MTGKLEKSSMLFFFQNKFLKSVHYTMNQAVVHDYTHKRTLLSVLFKKLFNLKSLPARVDTNSTS